MGNYKSVLEELELLGISSTPKKIEALHSIILQASSLKEALDLLNNLSDSEKTKLHRKARADFKEKAKKAEAIKLQKKATKESAEQQRKEEEKATLELNKKKLQEADIFNFSLQITDYMIVRGKFRAELESEVRSKMREGWVPFGGVSAAAFGISTIGGNSFIQAMVRYRRS